MNFNRSSKKKLNILIADDVHEILVNGLSEAGHNVLYLPNVTRHEIIKYLKQGVSGLIIRSKTKVDADLLRHTNGLQFVARAGAGMDNIDEAFAAKQHVLCFNSAEGNADAVGEHTVGMLLMLLNKLSLAHAQVKQKIWLREENRGTELSGKTIGIIGFGNTGKAVAQKLCGFQVNVLAYDKYLKKYSNAHAKQAGMRQIFNQADIITLHVPLTHLTNKMVNNAFIGSFKKNIYLLNLSRGQVINTGHVINAMQKGKIKGVALDVLENEDLHHLNLTQQKHFNYLVNSANVV